MASEIKPIYGTERTRLAEVVPLDMPYSMFVFPTTYCNFKCVYCGYSLGYKNMKEKYDFAPETMTLETYEKVLNQIKEFPRPLKMLSLTAQGEPLINQNIGKMVKMAKDAGVAERIEIITNGSLLTNEMANQLIEAGLDTLRISVQGVTAKKYKEICGANINFERFMDNIKYFYKYKGNTNLFVKIMDVALEPGEDEVFYDLFRECSDRMYIEKMLPAYEGVEITKGMDVEYDRYGRVNTKREVCPLPFFMLGVFPNGDVEPCDTIYKPIVLGNVQDTTLLEMWNGQQIREFWKQQLEKRRCENSKCAMCCAPNDVSHPEDVLDYDVKRILDKIDKL